MADLTGQQFGDYRLLRPIGKGGQASVYLGQHLRLKPRHVAIKILHASVTEQDIEAFRQEANTIAALHHPHIVNVLDFDIQQGIPFLVMEYYPDGSLRERYPRGERVPLAIVVSYVKQVAQALQHAHDHRLIHRDVKAANMLIGRQGEIVLTDFGIVAIAHSTSSIGAQNFAGTAPYMAPEQIKQYPRRESDQYALAVVVYEWLSGKLPFIGTPEEIAIKHLTVEPPSLREILPDLSPLLEQVIFKALAKDPKERFATIEAFAMALEQAIQDAEPTIPSLGISSSIHPNQSSKSGQERHLLLDEAVLVKSYEAVQHGNITDPETIRSVAANFQAIANDPKANQMVSFDAARAARALYEQARQYEDAIDAQQRNKKQPSRQIRHTTDEHMQDIADRPPQQRQKQGITHVNVHPLRDPRGALFAIGAGKRWSRLELDQQQCLLGIALLVLSLLLVASLTVFSSAPVFSTLDKFLITFFGWSAYLLSVGLVALALAYLIGGIRRQHFIHRAMVVGTICIWLLLLTESRLILGQAMEAGVLAEILVMPLLGWSPVIQHTLVLVLLLITVALMVYFTLRQKRSPKA